MTVAVFQCHVAVTVQFLWYSSVFYRRLPPNAWENSTNSVLIRQKKVNFLSQKLLSQV